MSGTSYPTSQLRPPVQAAAYAIGASIGGLLSFGYVAPVTGGAAIVQGVAVTFASGVVPAMDLVLFNQNPAASTVTDRVAVAIAAVDLPKVVGVLHITDATLLGASAPSVMQATTAVMPFDLPSGGTQLFGALIARAAATLGSTTDVTVSLNTMWG